jgi:DNA-binding NarL/FixJ family response regulator
MRVLIADDSDLILERIKEMLAAHKQVEIVAALKNGTETLNALRLLKPDLAIVDIKMPGLSGLEVLAEIRKEDQTLKFIMLTFYSSEHYRKLADTAGTDYFFNKGDDFDKVSLAIAELIAGTKCDTLMSNRNIRDTQINSTKNLPNLK